MMAMAMANGNASLTATTKIVMWIPSQLDVNKTTETKTKNNEPRNNQMELWKVERVAFYTYIMLISISINYKLFLKSNLQKKKIIGPKRVSFSLHQLLLNKASIEPLCSFYLGKTDEVKTKRVFIIYLLQK